MTILFKPALIINMKLQLDTPAKVRAFAKKVQASYKKLEDGVSGKPGGFDAWMKEQDALEKELNEAQKALPKGLCIGKLVCFGVADGYAQYLVTKIGKRISKIEHLPFGDAYQYRGVESDGSVFTSSLMPWDF